MREIKFRAWDKVMNEMFYDSELSNGDLLVIHIDGRIELSDNDTYKISDFELMQYTGLKDKNGKEIYEGDILSGRSQSGVVVVWNEEMARFIVHPKWEYGLPMYTEVIGNIYENPELKEEE